MKISSLKSSLLSKSLVENFLPIAFKYKSEKDPPCPVFFFLSIVQALVDIYPCNFLQIQHTVIKHVRSSIKQNTLANCQAHLRSALLIFLIYLFS